MQLNAIDIALVVVIAIFFVRGFRLGFILVFGQLVSLVIGAVAAAYAVAWTGDLFGIPWSAMPWAGIIAFIVIMGIAARLIMLAFAIVNQLWRIISIVPFLGPLNRLAGSAVGAAEGAIVVVLIAYLSDFIGFGSFTVWFAESRIFRYALGIAERLEFFLPTIVQ